MKKILLLLTILAICLHSFGQKKSKTSNEDIAFEQAYSKYKNAVKYLDYKQRPYEKGRDNFGKYIVITAPF